MSERIASPPRPHVLSRFFRTGLSQTVSLIPLFLTPPLSASPVLFILFPVGITSLAKEVIYKFEKELNLLKVFTIYNTGRLFF